MQKRNVNNVEIHVIDKMKRIDNDACGVVSYIIY